MKCANCEEPIVFVKRANTEGKERAEARHVGTYTKENYANVGTMLGKRRKQRLAVALALMCEAGEAG